MNRFLSWLALGSVVLIAGCEDGGEGGHLDQAKVDQAFANGNSVVWVESKSDFWDIRNVRASGTTLGSNAGTYELAPGTYSLAVTCHNDPWKDQWAREHDAQNITQSINVTAVAGQIVHAIVDSTGEGARFDLYVAQ